MFTNKILAVLVVLWCVCLAIVGQIFIKSGVSEVSQKMSLVNQYVKIFTHPRVLIGFLFYLLSSIFWVKLLQYVPLSFAYPLVAMGYIILVLCAKIFLGEHVPLIRWMGVFFICLGVILISRS